LILLAPHSVGGKISIGVLRPDRETEVICFLDWGTLYPDRGILTYSFYLPLPFYWHAIGIFLFRDQETVGLPRSG
jgi:hypothetical protein